MKETINKLYQEMNSLQDRVSKISAAIKALQQLCQHDWKPNGSDSHKDHEKCDICGDSRSI